MVWSSKRLASAELSKEDRIVEKVDGLTDGTLLFAPKDSKSTFGTNGDGILVGALVRLSLCLFLVGFMV